VGVFHAGPTLFRTGWFVESLATQTLVIFAIRTRRSPFWRSRPGGALTASALAVVAVGVALTLSPLSSVLGYTVPPAPFLLVVAVMVLCYLALVEVAKRLFYAERPAVVPVVRRRGRTHRVHRRAAPFSHRGPLVHPPPGSAIRGGPSPLWGCRPGRRGWDVPVAAGPGGREWAHRWT
jgi:P-type Mg2+ transporter